MKVLFVCHANVCRSFMAQELLRKHRPDICVFSRGLYADPAYTVPQKVFDFLQSRHIYPAPHISAQLATEDLEKADYVFFMEQAHLEQVLDRFAQYTDKCYLVGEFATGYEQEIPDPVSLSGGAFWKVAEKLEQTVQACAQKLGQ